MGEGLTKGAILQLLKATGTADLCPVQSLRCKTLRKTGQLADQTHKKIFLQFKSRKGRIVGLDPEFNPVGVSLRNRENFD